MNSWVVVVGNYSTEGKRRSRRKKRRRPFKDEEHEETHAKKWNEEWKVVKRRISAVKWCAPSITLSHTHTYTQSRIKLKVKPKWKDMKAKEEEKRSETTTWIDINGECLYSYIYFLLHWIWHSFYNYSLQSHVHASSKNIVYWNTM